MILQKIVSQLRYVAAVAAISLLLILLIEIAAFLLSPERYEDPPPVTAADWIYSDALPPRDTVWMKEFVDEFLRSYDARWASYVYFRRKPFSGKTINIDTNGIRFTPQFTRASVEGSRPVRVFLLGGSTMWGTCARDSGTIPSALSRLIASDTGSVPTQVVNLGESGYVSTQTVLRLELELRKGNVPDIVILYDGVNDVFSAYQNDEPGLPQNEMHRSEEFNLLKDGGRMRRLGWDDFFKRTVTASLLNDIRSAVAGSPPSASIHPVTVAGVVRLYRGNLEIVEALSKEFDFRYEAYWQPVVFSKNAPSPYEVKQSEKLQYIRPLFHEVYGCIGRDSVLQNQRHFHDLERIFDTAGVPVYLDFCHVTEAGNAMIARRIFNDIRDSLHRGIAGHNGAHASH